MTMPLILHVVLIYQCQLLFFVRLKVIILHSQKPLLSLILSLHLSATCLLTTTVATIGEMFTCMYVCRLLPRQHIKMLLVCLFYTVVLPR